MPFHAATAPRTSAWSLRVRPSRPSDLPALTAFFERCSDDTLLRRFHGVAGPALRSELARIASSTETHRSWIAVDGDVIHGTSTLAWGRDGEVEVAFVVEDAWTRRGLGRRLLAAALAEAEREGLTSVVARVQGGNEGARRFLRASAADIHSRFVGAGELEIDIELPARPLPTPASRPLAFGVSA